MMVIAGRITRALLDDDGGNYWRRVIIESDGRAKEGSGSGTAPMVTISSRRGHRREGVGGVVESSREVAGLGERKAKSDGEAKDRLDPRKWRRSGRRRSGLLERPPTRLFLLRLWVVQPLHLRQQHFERFADVLVVLRRRLDVCRAELLGESLTLGGRDGSAR